MANELAIFEEASGIISNIVKTYKSFSIIRQEDKIKLKIQLDVVEKIARSRGAELIWKENFDILVKVDEMLDKADFKSEYIRKAAMKSIEDLWDKLERSLEEY